MSANATTTTKTAVIVGGPLAWAREPTQSASKGPPVQTLTATTVIAAASNTRLSLEDGVPCESVATGKV